MVQTAQCISNIHCVCIFTVETILKYKITQLKLHTEANAKHTIQKTYITARVNMVMHLACAVN